MLSNRLKQCRTARGLSVKELAARSGVSARLIYKIENARNYTAPRWPTIHALSAGLDLPANRVFPERRHPNDP